MKASEILQFVATVYASAWGLYLLLIPVVAYLWRSRPRPLDNTRAQWPTIAVLIPAANVARELRGCVGALRSSNYPMNNVQIYVIADHCTDNTVENAQRACANVLIRNDGPRGKTYAIAWALNELQNHDVFPDLCIIVDATAVVEPNFITAMVECWQHGEDIISGHSILKPENSAWYVQCLGLMLTHRNFQCWARERLELSALLEGRGMAYGKNYIRRFGWSLALPKAQTSHPTEDWRHAVRAVERGYRVAFEDKARVATPLRGSLSKATQQGARWERGRLINAGTYAIRLLMLGIWQRNPRKIFAALDAMQPPVAILAALSIGTATVTFFLAPGIAMLRIAGYLPVIVIGLYGVVVMIKGRREGIPLITAIWGPIYLVWRCSAFVLAWAFLDRLKLGWRGSDMG
jgi:cellulose synthase/poly-beta-1,6-N-acetylglucosamine synthase-like glycosyltransferase